MWCNGGHYVLLFPLILPFYSNIIIKMLSPQDWIWDAFSLYDSLYSFMHPFILRMNTKSRTFYAEPSKFKRLIWCFSIIVNVGILLWGSSLYVLVKWNRKPTSVKVVHCCCCSFHFGTWSSCFVHMLCTLQVQRCACSGHEQFAAAPYCKNGYVVKN